MRYFTLSSAARVTARDIPACRIRGIRVLHVHRVSARCCRVVQLHWFQRAEGLDSPPPSKCTVLQSAEGRHQGCAVLPPESGQPAAFPLHGVAEGRGPLGCTVLQRAEGRLQECAVLPPARGCIACACRCLSCTVLQRAEGQLQGCAVLPPEPGQPTVFPLHGVAEGRGPSSCTVLQRAEGRLQGCAVLRPQLIWAARHLYTGEDFIACESTCACRCRPGLLSAPA